MSRITQIKSQKKKNRFNIYLDNKFAFGLAAEDLAKAGLKVGQELDEKSVEELINQSLFQKLLDRTLRFLSLRPRSEKEITNYLNNKLEQQLSDDRSGEKEKLISRIMDRLKEFNLIDDGAFACWWCEQRLKFRPRSKRALLLELRQKGISRQIAETAIAELVNEKKLLLKLVPKKIEIYQKRGLPEFEVKKKIINWLQGQGYSWKNIEAVIDKFIKKS